ncbi:hypothetical protein [uncultured Serinicoccus sp.]|uniref:hypothetical protein n=1 Tax=uncultured Serinicoccus sp. TaxID=735514 RepID=UPI002627DC9A|nr:hypothetical protein [uncultured Serinicoccus sp.]
MTAVERAEERVALLKRAVSLTTELQAVETERDRLLGQRAETCRQLRGAGASIAELQDVLGVSRGRVHQILRDTGGEKSPARG